MAIQGLRDTSGFTVTGQRPENWREGTLLLFPNGDMPLTALTSVMKSESTDDPKYHWFEKIMSDQRMALTTAPVTGTTLAMTGGGGFECRPGTLLLFEETGEIAIVTTVTSDTALEVARSWGSVAATNVPIASNGVNPYITIIGTAVEEGSSAPIAIMYDPTERWNYTQIFRNTLNATRTAINTRLRTGDQIREAKREALQYHGIEQERSFWFGEKIKDTFNGSPRRTTEGFVPWLTATASGQVVTPSGNSMDMNDLEDYMRLAFEYGSSEKMAFAGNRALLNIQRILRKNSATPYTLMQGQKEFGMNVSRLICPFGELVIKTHPLFNRMTSADDGGTWYYGYDAAMAILDMENVKYRYLKNSDTKFSDNIQANDKDAKQAGYLTECGMEFHHANTHLLIKGIGTGVADA